MIGRRERIAVVALALEAFGCARRTDAETRAAFEAASRSPRDAGRSPRTRPGRRPRRNTADARTTWQAIADVLDASIVLLGSDIDAATFTTTATGWCAVAPEPRATDAGPLYVCFPRDPLQLDQRTFTLEVSPSGVIGLNMDELDEPTSRSLAEQARAAVIRLCATPFVAAPTQDAELGTFHACPVDGGATLAVGRGRSTAGPGWFVTMTVLGDLRRSASP